MKKLFKNNGFLFYILIIFLLLSLSKYGLNSAFSLFGENVEHSFSDILNDIKNQKIEFVKLDGSSLKITYKDTTTKEQTPSVKNKIVEKEIPSYWMTPLLEVLENNNVKFDYVKPINFSSWFNAILIFLMIATMGFFFWMSIGKGFGDAKGAMTFGRSRHRVHNPKDSVITFNDIAGADEEKEYLQEVVEYLKEPKRFTALGAKVPRGILLVGPPGTGKTLLAKAVAGEANVPFLSISGSDFVEMFVGVGASRVRDLFAEAKKMSPCIIFIDEIDAVGRHRGAGMGGGHDEREQTLNQMLVEMDGFKSNDEIIILAATNRPDILDPALLRPGRFDHKITVNRPDIKGRAEILKIHAKNKPIDKDVDLREIAQITPGFSGADLANLLNEAALICAKRRGKSISYNDIQEAVFNTMIGVEKKSRVISDKEKKITAYHEAGHAIVVRAVSQLDRVERVSIISAGDAGGYTAYKPYEDRYYYTKQNMLDVIKIALAGRAAEQLIFNEITTGASSDLKHCNSIARDMICVYGMSDKMLNMYYGGNNDEVFLGKDYGHVKNYSQEVAENIDNEVKLIISTAYDEVLSLLKDRMQVLEVLSQKLLEVEKVDGDEFELIYLENTTEEQRKNDAKNVAVEACSKRVLKKKIAEIDQILERNDLAQSLN